MSTGPAYAQVAQLHRLAARQAGACVRPLADGDGEVVSLPTTELARGRAPLPPGDLLEQRHR